MIIPLVGFTNWHGDIESKSNLPATSSIVPTILLPYDIDNTSTTNEN